MNSIRFLAAAFLFALQLHAEDAPSMPAGTPAWTQRLRSLAQQQKVDACFTVEECRNLNHGIALGLTKAQFDSIGSSRALTALFYEPNPTTSILLFRAIFGKNKKAALLSSSDNEGQRLVKWSKDRGVTLDIFTVKNLNELGRAYRRMADITSIIVASDNFITDPDTFRTVLLGSYRHDIPVLAFTEGMVNAGAVAGVVVNEVSYIKAAEDFIAKAARNERLPEPQYSPTNTLSVRTHSAVARSFKLDLDVSKLNLGIIE